MKIISSGTATRPTTEAAAVEVTPEVAENMAGHYAAGKAVIEKGGNPLFRVELENAEDVSDYMGQARQWGKDHKPALTVRAYSPRKADNVLPENEAWFTVKKTDPEKKIGRPAGTTNGSK